VSIDARFHAAWQLVRAGRHAAAALALDDLLAAAGANPRRADILYWSARSHAAAGNRALARARIAELLRAHPDSWHRADAEALNSLLNHDQ
jgi:hypothetical protein